MLPSVHELVANVPLPAPTEKSTVPLGVVGLPALLSVTVAVHVAWTPASSAPHVIAVASVRCPAVRSIVVLAPGKSTSPEYVTSSTMLPSEPDVAMNTTEHEPTSSEAPNVHTLPICPDPVAMLHEAVPVGADVVPAAVSVAETVHVTGR